MTAAKIMSVVARLPNCDGQATDAVSAYTLVILEDALRLLISPTSECPDLWTRLPRHMAQIMEKFEIPWYFLNENLYGHPLAALLWERQFEEGFGLRGESPSGKKGRKACKIILRGKCKEPSCDLWHRLTC